ncbi:MAG: polysaccharide biosynthesis/export family protein [Phycisphaerales bacterium]|nr:polysaccharide biosynthesis/export family protein [Phycisphaerales bacterium]
MGRTSDTLDVPLTRRPGLRPLGIFAACGLAAALSGCSTDLDTYMDPSKPIRAEATPAVVPILDRIAAIEGPADRYVEQDSIRTEDLRPEASEYRISPGDQLDIRIWDIISPGQVEDYPLLVDTRGVVTIPQLGDLSVAGLTADQVRDTVSNASSKLVNNPLVQVTVTSSRKQTFTVLGAVGNPGAYFIPAPDFRLLEAITVAGGASETIPAIFVIRQIPLDAQAVNQGAGAAPAGESGGQNGEQLIDLIDNLTGKPAGGSPGVMSSSAQPDSGGQPAVDLVEGSDAPTSAAQPDNTSAWIFVNGQWVRAARADGRNGAAPGPESVVTQRVIRVPLKPLLAGDARYNIVVRPGDVLRIPPPEQGFVYLDGEVARPGSFNLPPIGPFTLRRAIASSGGLSPVGIPERCDLTRMVGENRQATIMLNYRAIVEGTQPDVVLKPNDIISIGTTFWAYPLAVFRQGFRATYGFGFLLDRNFGNDVFGAPPTNRLGQ